MSIRSVASLSPTLLARKGAARPAMRAQLQPLRQLQEKVSSPLDDLGWNDMGHDAPEPLPQHAAEVVPITPGGELPSAAAPIVTRQHEEIATLITLANAKGGEKGAAKSRRSAFSQGRRAAFTLRLDAERHLQLRLAAVVRGRSAQQIVSEALDRLLADLPEVSELAARVRDNR
jgi:hypothetical protein